MKKENQIKARQWAKEHRTHVLQMILGDDNYGYPPSKEDEGHPELWKSEHWQWFFNSDYGKDS